MLSNEQRAYIEDIKANYPETSVDALVDLLRQASWSTEDIEQSLGIFARTADTSAVTQTPDASSYESDFANKKLYFVSFLAVFVIILISLSAFAVSRLWSKAASNSSLPQDLRIELVNTIQIPGTITGAYRDINDIQLLSDGTLAYKKSIIPRDTYYYEEGDITETFYIGKESLAGKDSLSPVKEIAGRKTYLKDSDSGFSRTSLIYGTETEITDVYVSQFTEIHGRLAYTYRHPESTTESLVYAGRILDTATQFSELFEGPDGSIAYIKSLTSDDGINNRTALFVNGTEIKTSGNVVDAALVGGSLAYITYDQGLHMHTLFYQGNAIDSAPRLGRLMDLNGKLVYQKQAGTDAFASSTLIVDGAVAATGDLEYTTKEIAGSLAYVATSISPSTFEVETTLVHNGIEVASTTAPMGWARVAGDVISHFFAVNSLLAYIISSDESSSLYYGGELVKTAQLIGTSYDEIQESGTKYTPKIDKTNPPPFYFYEANEADGVVTFNIYRINK